MKPLILSALVLLVFAPPLLQAKTFKIPKDKPIATITFPDAWDASYVDEGVEGTSADEEIYVYIEDNDASTIEGAVKEMFAYLAKKKVTVKPDTLKKTEAKMNGMDVVDLAYDGEDADGPTHISLTILGITNKKGLLMLYWANPAKEKKHQEELNGILQSIQPVK